MTPWQTTKPAIRAINAIRPTDLGVILDRPLVGPDALILTGGVIETLDAIRLAHVDAEFGCTFMEANAESRARAEAYLDAYAEQPTVQAVLAETFGDPNLLIGHGAEKADAMWRAAMARGQADVIGLAA